MEIDARIARMSQDRAELARTLGFLDCNLWLGRPEGFPLAHEIGAGELAEHLEAAHLTGGLVSHWWGKTSSAQDGNQALARVDGSLPQGCWTIWTGLPLYPREPGMVPGPGMTHRRLRGVRLYPRAHNFPLGEWSTGGLCQWMVERNLPLFLQHPELDWSSLRQLALKFPTLAIVVESQTRKILYHTRPLFMLMKECGNILLEISNFCGPGFLEHAAREFGAHRLLFGSFLPAADPLVPMGMVLDAELPLEQKAMIAAGNLRRLVEGVRA